MIEAVIYCFSHIFVKIALGQSQKKVWENGKLLQFLKLFETRKKLLVIEENQLDFQKTSMKVLFT